MLIGNSSLSTFVQILNARYDKGSDLIRYVQEKKKKNLRLVTLVRFL